MGQYMKVATAGEVSPGEARLVEAGGKQIALFNVDGAYFALDNTCTHRGGPLAEGFIEGSAVTCPWHGAQFDIKSGQVMRPPAPQGVTLYPTRIVGEDVEVEV
ncbi:MAG: non-heme iron oxygenase ferredoxin subunit [Acidobacteria bacterium]|nr:non-heme iron oxygenase ferredoxin subunit [Acidobacteriota bacterium]